MDGLNEYAPRAGFVGSMLRSSSHTRQATWMLTATRLTSLHATAHMLPSSFPFGTRDLLSARLRRRGVIAIVKQAESYSSGTVRHIPLQDPPWW